MDIFSDIVKNSAFHFPYVDVKMPRMLSHNYEDMNFSVNGLIKDLECIEQLAKDVHVKTEVISTMKTLYKEAANRSDAIRGQEGKFASFMWMCKGDF